MRLIYGLMAISPYVIEFEAPPPRKKAFLDDPKSLQPVPRAAAGQAEAFLVLSPAARGAKEPTLPELPPAVKAEANRHLLEVLDILQKGRFEFAFRAAKEVVASGKVSRGKPEKPNRPLRLMREECEPPPLG